MIHQKVVKLTLLIVIISLACLPSQAQKVENSIFWEVTGNGLSAPSYIYGTVKFIPEKDYFLSKNVKNKLKECEIFATETMLDHHSLRELNKAAHLPHHESIEDLLTAEQYGNLRKIFINQLNVSKTKFELVYSQFKPVVLSTTMTRLSLGDDVKYYELELVKMAKKQGLLTLGLETASREIEAIETFSKENQTKALIHTIANFNKQKMDYKELIASYKLGNLHNTLEYTLHPSENDMSFRSHFYDQRNAEWVPQIEKYMKQSPSFFAVGVAHLADDKGLIQLLRAKGYTVSPFPLQ